MRGSPLVPRFRGASGLRASKPTRSERGYRASDLDEAAPASDERPTMAVPSSKTKTYRGTAGRRGTVGRVREVADQYAVEAGPLVNARRLGKHVGIKRRSGRRD